VGRRQRDRTGAGVLLQVVPALGAGDRYDIPSLRHHPRKSELSGGAALLPRHRLDLVDQRQVAGEVLALEARVAAAEVVLVEVVRRRQRAGEEAAAERAERDDPDTQLPGHAEHPLLVGGALEVAGPER